MVDFTRYILNGVKQRDPDNDLDCVICGRWFPTFDRLAKHMYAKHGPPVPASESDPWAKDPNLQQAWSKHSGAANFSPSHYTGMDTPFMAKKSAFPKPPNEQRESKSGGDDTRNPFLKAADIGKVGTEADVTIVAGSARTGPSVYGSGEQVIVTVRHKGKMFDFGMDPTKPNYRILYDAKGDPGKWKGTIPIKVLAGNSNYIAVQRMK